jgi:hypothetical protein
MNLFRPAKSPDDERGTTAASQFDDTTEGCTSSAAGVGEGEGTVGGASIGTDKVICDKCPTDTDHCNVVDSIDIHNETPPISELYSHGLEAGDHIVRWKMLGFCYPIQIHGIVLSVGPDIVTIVDCGLSSVRVLDKSGDFDDAGKNDVQKYMKTRRRMNVLTLVDEKEIKKWSKIRYGEEVELRLHNKGDGNCNTTDCTAQQHEPTTGENDTPQQSGNASQASDCFQDESNDLTNSLPSGLELEEEEGCEQSDTQQNSTQMVENSPSKPLSFWPFFSTRKSDAKSIEGNLEASAHSTTESSPAEKVSKMKQEKTPLTLPKSDPPILVLARLRFLLEYGDETPQQSADEKKAKVEPLLPPHHLLYANSECLAVWCKTGHWSTLQASVFLSSTSLGNAKQTATLAMFLSAQTVTIPASGFWGFFGGTTTVSLFSTQPWLVPALVGGGVVYVGIPMVMLWKAKGRWGETENKLNDAFWRIIEPEVIVELIRCWSGLNG